MTVPDWAKGLDKMKLHSVYTKRMWNIRSLEERKQLSAEYELAWKFARL